MLTRRRFVHTTALAGAGLLVGCRLAGEPALAQSGVVEADSFVRVAPDNTVTLIAKHVELGQGSHTGLATILAEELDADWSQVRVEAAPVHARVLKRYINWKLEPLPSYGTGGSTSMADSWKQLREAGARARAMLVAAAARDWKVPAAEIVVKRGIVSHGPSGRRATFGELAVSASTLSPPRRVTLKDPKDFTLVGRPVLPRLDTAAKIDGSATFTIDVAPPGVSPSDMLTALIVRPPRFGATVKSFDASAARAVKGVIHVDPIPSGIAVVARGFWAARKGREQLQGRVTWDESGVETADSEKLFADYRGRADRRGRAARRDGNTDDAFRDAAKVLTAYYEFPYLAHAPMEPLDAVVRLGPEFCEIWTGSQVPAADFVAAEKALLPSLRKVRIHTMLAGGSFGRRATPDGDVVGEAVAVAKVVGGDTPVRLMWTREDDIQGGRYRPLYVHRLRGGLDAQGNIVGWEHRVVGQSILTALPLAAELLEHKFVDRSSVEGAHNLPYSVPNVTVELTRVRDVRVPVLWWRSVGSTHTAFSTETFLDELAHAAGRDPLEVRRALLTSRAQSRHRATLDLAAEKAGWGTALPPGRARGIALHESFHTVVAQVAEVSVRPDGVPKVHRVVCAGDCGTAINPDVVKAQMEGGIGYGLGAALWNEVTLEDGRVKQRNFDDYRPLRIGDMPAVDVHIVRSGNAPTGVGEPGVPPIAPAVANALFRLTGRRVRRLPFARLAALGTRAE
jgi:isoquinoline 1-oxidoreductase beta subunit